MLLPAVCAACGALGASPCRRCRAQVRRPPPLPAPSGVDWCSVLLAYEGVGREVVARFKYRNARSSLRWLAGGMADLVTAADRRGGIDVVTWVPTTADRRRARGFDQGRLLARAVARNLGLPCRPLLRRLPGPPQTGAGRHARLVGPRLALRSPSLGPRTPWAPSAPAHVLLVDDVVTTGATLAAAAGILRRAGTTSVGAVVAAGRGAHH